MGRYHFLRLDTLRAAAFAFFYFEGAAADIIDGFYAVFPCCNIQVEHLPEAVLVGNVKIHGLPLIDMTLAETAGADAPELINGVGVFIQPIGFEREGRGNTGYQRAFLFLQKIALHDGIDAGGGACDNRGGTRRSDR